MTHQDSAPCAAIRCSLPNGQTSIFFFETPQLMDNYVNWLCGQPKDQWNIIETITRVYRGTDAWYAHRNFIHQMEIEAWENNQ
jgi:hypothetical protein